MSFTDKVKNKADELTGKAKQAHRRRHGQRAPASPRARRRRRRRTPSRPAST